jgi:hypothetical protein
MKRKTIRPVSIAAAVLLGIALVLQAHTGSDKYSRPGNPVSNKFTHTVKLTGVDIRNQPVESRRFETEYLSEESSGAIEPWMLDTNYLGEEVQPLESWMFSESRLSEGTSENDIESWMFDANYLSRE